MELVPSTVSLSGPEGVIKVLPRRRKCSAVPNSVIRLVADLYTIGPVRALQGLLSFCALKEANERLRSGCSYAR